MRSTRIIQALESGLISLPATGTIVVFGAEGLDDVQALPMERVLAVARFYPDHQRLAALGVKVATEAGTGHAAALVCLPRAKAEARAVLAEAAAAVVSGGLVIVDGAKTDGIEPVWRDLKGRVAVTETLAKAHGRIFGFPADGALADWAAGDAVLADGWITRPGVFSADGPDRASVLLAGILPPRLPGYVVDLGAGWGYLARAILARAGVKRLDLVEADAVALDCARRNISDERARFVWADATDWRADGYADQVVMNPPFHRGRQAEPALGLGFIATAQRILSPKGTLWMVANRNLPYAADVKLRFAEVEEIGNDPVFRLIRASFPHRPK